MMNIRGQNCQRSPEWNPSGINGSRILPPATLIYLRQNGRISRLPNVTEEEIHDKSKAIFLVKALAVVQVFWVCMQVIVRTTWRLAISQLELQVTALFASTISSLKGSHEANPSSLSDIYCPNSATYQSMDASSRPLQSWQTIQD